MGFLPYVLVVLAVLQPPVFSLFHKDVTPSNFDKLLNPSDSHLLMEFYAPWCGHVRPATLFTTTNQFSLDELYARQMCNTNCQLYSI